MNNSYLYVDPNLQSVGSFADPQLATFTERHHLRVPTLPLRVTTSLQDEVRNGSFSGVVFAMAGGLPTGKQMDAAAFALRHNRPVYFYWPSESAVEVIDRERLSSLRRHRLIYIGGIRLMSLIGKLRARREARRGVTAGPVGLRPESIAHLDNALKFASTDYAGTRAHLVGGIAQMRILGQSFAAAEVHLRSVQDAVQSAADVEAIRVEVARLAESLATLRSGFDGLQSHMDGGEVALNRLQTILDDLGRTVEGVAPTAAAAAPAPEQALTAIEGYRETLAAFAAAVRPVPFAPMRRAPSPQSRLSGTGVYVRTDYWAQLISGGSYGHTCYVAKELAERTERFTALMASHYALLDDLGIPQEVIRPPLVTATEVDWMKADQFYYGALKERFAAERPAYIYERLCMGNFAAARLSRELGIPYILEYNGSEISMRRSFGSGAFEHEELLLKAEELAFAQATAITVISEHVRNDVLRRGIDPAKVFVNPNGVDPEEYAPGSPEERREIRGSLGFADTDRVVGFIGTFGGWHGIDVLAEALPAICRGAPETRFLLIGDGHLKPLVLEAVRKHGIEKQVVDVGRTDQRTGARLLKAADIFVSPHSAHMRDSPFFGSPTKLFEYMALGGGIVASDLEQLGVVMSPSLRPADFDRPPVTVGQNRGVLCKPGDVGEFTAGVLGLVRNPDIAAALGRNARAAVLAQYTWARHVETIWDHVLSSAERARSGDAVASR